MPRDLDEIHAGFCRLFTHATRIRLLLALERSPCCVGDLVSRLGVRQSAVSQHLALLRVHGLVTGKRKGRQVCYRLTNPKILTAFKIMRREIQRMRRAGTAG